MVDNREEQLRARAYGIWQSEGEPHGRDREHWEMAERELTAPEEDISTPERPAPSSRGKPATGDQAAPTDPAEPKARARKPRAVKPR